MINYCLNDYKLCYDKLIIKTELTKEIENRIMNNIHTEQKIIFKYGLGRVLFTKWNKF